VRRLTKKWLESKDERALEDELWRKGLWKKLAFWVKALCRRGLWSKALWRKELLV
jgi:hypothetical protein